jgi:hypothetical protein
MTGTEEYFDENDNITEDDIQDIAQRAGHAAAQETRVLAREEEEGHEDDMVEGYGLSAKEKISVMIKNLKAKDELDIFDDVGEALAKVGHFVTYQIKKNGSILATKGHPFSWGKIQVEFGEGRYTVTAKSADNVYIKTQTESVHARTVKDEDSELNNSSNNDGNLTTLDFISMMEKNAKNATAEAERRADRDRENLMAMITAMKPEKDNSSAEIMKTMQNKSDDMLKLVIALVSKAPDVPKDNSTDMLKFMVDLQNKQQEKTERMFEKMQENNNKLFEAIITTQNSKPEAIEPEFSAIKVMEMVENARNGGFEQYSLITQMAETIAEKNAVTGDGGDESITNTLIKSLAPAVGAMMANKATNPAPTAQPRGTLPPTQRVQTTRPAQAHRQTNPQKSPVRAAGATQNAKPTEQNRQDRTLVRKNPKQSASSLPSVENMIDVEVPTVEAEEFNHEVTQVASDNYEAVEVVETIPESGTIEVNEAHKALIIETSVPLIIGCYSESKSITETVNMVMEAFHQSGVNLNRVHIDFTQNDIQEIVKGAGLDGDMSDLLKEFYVELIQTIETVRKSA